MIEAMPRPRMPYLSHEPTRHGKMVWYFRRNGKRIRLRADFGTPEFQALYAAALTGTISSTDQHTTLRRPASGSLQWLYDRYRESAGWRELSSATRRQRMNILAGVMETAGSNPYAAITRASIEAGKDRRADTPAQSRNFLDAMRGLFRWGLAAGHVRVDPTAGVANPKRPPGEGFAPWTEADVAAYERRWATGTRQRVWLHVLLYTGLRRGDAVRLGRQHVRDGIASLRTEKTGTDVVLPVLPDLAAALAGGPTGDLAFICGERGEPLTKESFGNVFSAACRAADIPKSAHGVRKLAATIMAENGATVAELESVFGWQGGAMASLYTRGANRKRLAIGAMHKLARTTEEPLLSHHPETVRQAVKKAQ